MKEDISDEVFRFVFFAAQLEFLHKSPIDTVFDPDGDPAAEGQFPPAEYAGAPSHVENQQVILLWVKRGEGEVFQSVEEVMVKNGVLADRIDAHLGQRAVLEMDAVTAAEHLRISRGLEKRVDQQAAVGPVGSPESLNRGRGTPVAARQNRIQLCGRPTEGLLHRRP